MSKFCTNCGKPLNDNQPCSCKSKGNDSNTFFDDVKDVCQMISTILRKPKDFVESRELNKKSWLVNVVFITISMFLSFIMIFKVFIETITQGLFLGDISLSDLPFEYWVKLIIFFVICSFISILSISTVVHFLGTKILKKEVDYKFVFNKLSYIFTVIGFALLSASVGLYIHYYVSIVILSFVFVYWCLLIYELLINMFKATDKKNFIILCTPVVIVLSSIINSILVNIITKIIF